MPRIKYAKLLNDIKCCDIFTFKFLEGKVGRAYAKLLLHKLRKRGEVVELMKGVYTSKKSPYMIAKALPRSYIGLGTAAFLHGMWEQVPNVIVLSPLVSKVVKGGERTIAGFKVILRKISEEMFFGYELLYLEELEGWVRVSDPEKTLIDMAYFDSPYLDEVLKRADVNRDKLKRYLESIRRRRVRGWRRVYNAIFELI